MKKVLYLLICFVIIGCSAFGYTGQSEVFAEAATKNSTKVSAPTASAKSGTYSVDEYKSITLKTTTKWAEIYYSLDEGKNFELYTGKIKLSKSTSLICYAALDGAKSAEVKFDYKLKVKVTEDYPEVSGSEYEEPFTFKLSTNSKNAKIYYTLDGTKPTTKSTQYSSKGIKIDKSVTLRYLVKKTGFTNRYVEKTFVFKEKSVSERAAATADDNDFIDLSDFDNRTYYNTLSASEKSLYRQMYDGVNNHDASTKLVDIPSKVSVPKVYELMMSESPELFWAHDNGVRWSYSSTNITQVTYIYTNSASDQAKRQPKLEAKADEILSAASENSSDLFEYVLYLHDWIVDNSEYELGNSATRDLAGTDDIILDGHGLCTAYSRAFMYLLHRSGINCVIVNGEADNGNYRMGHSWNKVLLDGNWYAFDVTWDDPVGGNGEHIYSYFGLTDAKMNKNHFADGSTNISDLECKKTDYNYYTHYEIKIYDKASDAAQALLDKIEEERLKGGTYAEVFCSSYTVAEKAMETVHQLGSNRLRCAFSVGYSDTKVHIQLK